MKKMAIKSSVTTKETKNTIKLYEGDFYRKYLIDYKGLSISNNVLDITLVKLLGF